MCAYTAHICVLGQGFNFAIRIVLPEETNNKEQRELPIRGLQQKETGIMTIWKLKEISIQKLIYDLIARSLYSPIRFSKASCS